MTKKVPTHPMLPVGVLPISVRDQEGRYSIEEAGMMLDSETNNGGGELLMNAAAAGGLKVYAPENNALFPVDQISAHRDYLEAYWDDLNAWLKANAPRIKFEFPAPESEPVTPVSVPTLQPAETLASTNKWDGHNLRRLLTESREPGVTQLQLAARYGVTRQRIAILLKKADDQFSPKRSAISVFANPMRKK